MISDKADYKTKKSVLWHKRIDSKMIKGAIGMYPTLQIHKAKNGPTYKKKLTNWQTQWESTRHPPKPESRKLKVSKGHKGQLKK